MRGIGSAVLLVLNVNFFFKSNRNAIVMKSVPIIGSLSLRQES
jgi:hypothetical protein